MFESLSNTPDPRSRTGQMARGANIYMGASKSPWAGTPTQQIANQTLSKVPQYKKMSLQDVARTFLNGNRSG